MPAQMTLYQEVCQRIANSTVGANVPRASIRRLALLSIGIIAAESCVTAKMADKLFALKLTGVSDSDCVKRRIQRALSDERIDPGTCYQAVLRRVIDWNYALNNGNQVLLIVDESSNKDQVHLLRVSLAYWGATLPLAWEIWEQNKKMPEGSYWAKVKEVLNCVESLLPCGLEVMVAGDRAYDNPPFVDEITARHWHWIVRCKARSSLRFRDQMEREYSIRSIIDTNVNAPGLRWKGRGWLFKNAGWREASVIAVWGAGEKEPLVIATDLPPKWEMVHWYGRRFWIEAGFRNDKTRGWQWEDSQVHELGHHKRLLVAMAWATLLVLCRGVEEAKTRQERQAHTAARRKASNKPPAQPEHARQSVFTMGLRRAPQWFYGTANSELQWSLPDIDSVTWFQHWYKKQAKWLIY